jgi:hypothetical protein
MSKENSSGLDVLNQYGPRPTPDAASGVMKTEGGFNELTVELSGANINGSEFSTDVIIPAGSLIVDAYAEIEEVFSAGFSVGTSGSETTNGVPVTGTSVTVETLTPAGTWAVALATDTIVNVAWATSGTDAGKGRVVVRYLKV